MRFQCIEKYGESLRIGWLNMPLFCLDEKPKIEKRKVKKKITSFAMLALLCFGNSDKNCFAAPCSGPDFRSFVAASRSGDRPACSCKLSPVRVQRRRRRTDVRRQHCLHTAAGRNMIGMVGLLVAAGAQRNARNCEGDRPSDLTRDNKGLFV